MALRLSKCALLFAVGLFSLLVVFHNFTHYNSNYQFVHHVLLLMWFAAFLSVGAE